MNKFENILAIETSCDETAIAVYSNSKGLLAHKVYSQIELHRKHGGVVPELASRDHVRKIFPLISETLLEANLNLKNINGIAYTQGPGLIGALLVGATVAKTLAFSLDIPTIGVHHMEGHLLAPFLDQNLKNELTFPFLALLVSGGHTLLIKVTDIGQYEILGQSIDDAAGEAFDKTAKIMGLPYPGGPQIEKIALLAKNNKYEFPRPLMKNLKQNNLNFSFSGLKTFALNTFEKINSEIHKENILNLEEEKAEIADAFQKAVTDVFIKKCKQASILTGINKLIIAGGVSANKYLRTKFNELESEINLKTYYPKFEFCTDNAAMIAYAGMQRFQRGETSPLNSTVKPKWPLEQLN